MHRSSHQRFSIKKVVLKFRRVHRKKHLCHSLFFNKVEGSFLFSSYDYFCKITRQKIVGKIFFFCNETKMEVFVENRGHTFLDIDKNLEKQWKFDLRQLELVEVSRALGNWTQLGST